MGGYHREHFERATLLTPPLRVGDLVRLVGRFVGNWFVEKDGRRWEIILLKVLGP
jgi:hypothetical protein